MSFTRSSIRSIVVGGVAGALLLGTASGAIAGKPAPTSTSTTTSCSKRNPCPPPDTAPPTIAFTSPSNGAAVSGRITVTGNAGDNVGVARVDVRVDGGAFVAAAGTANWTSAIDTTGLGDGAHTITGRAADSAGLTTTASIGITVSHVASDSAAPTVAIASPAPGAAVAGSIVVTGSASDDTAISSVSVSIDGGAATPASGASSWSASVDTSSLADGPHAVAATARDAAGKSTTATVTVDVTNDRSDVVLHDPVATNTLGTLGRGRMAEAGSLTAMLYWETNTSRRAVFLSDGATGEHRYVDLPVDTAAGWNNASVALAGRNDLWVLSGDGPIFLRHYRLDGPTVPTTATLVTSQTFGTADSRMGDLVVLDSGAVVVVWHQQGTNGAAQGLSIAYRSAAGSWQTLPTLQFMPTKASKQVVVQHPADGSVWVLSDPDAWGRIGAVHLTEATGGLTVDWTDGSFIDEAKYGSNGPDPENPDLAVAADPSTGAIALAYQDRTRTIFSTSPVVTGSYVTVARIPATGAPSFLVLPTYVERVSSLGLSVGAGETWLTYRPIDTATMTFDQLERRVYRTGSWSTAERLGRLASPYERLGYSTTRPEIGVAMADGAVHLFSGAAS